MGSTIGSDGLLDEDRDLELASRSDKDCEGCSEPLVFGEPVVMLRLSYSIQQGGQLALLDALEKDNETYMADPLLFCSGCWDSYTEDLRAHRDELLISGTHAPNPSPLYCSFCESPIGYGCCVTHVCYGELDTSPRTQETTFLTQSETPEQAELLCMNCLCAINDICDETIWTHLWEED